MAFDPEENLPRKTKMEITVGQDISTLSVAELNARVEVLKNEIVRTQEALHARSATQEAASAFFKR